jgi:GTP-binding protein Era
MMDFVNQSLQDADVVLFITDNSDDHAEDEAIYERLKLIKLPLLVLVNKIDLIGDNQKVEEKITYIKSKVSNATAVIPVSALNKFGLDSAMTAIMEFIPEGPSYFPDDQLTDKSERFVASEIIREKIMMRYKEEIPYSVQVDVVEFKEDEKIIRISAEIYVMRDSQKMILIGKGGSALKNVGIAARRDLERFFDKQVFLQTFVKVKENWRDSDKLLKQFGYKED